MLSLLTPRCSLELLLPAHADAMFAVLSDPAIYEFENAPPDSVAALRARYQRQAARQSPDGHEQWLNWVLRLPDGGLAGDVQATVLPSGVALVAYELASQYWRQGIGSAAVRAMLHALAASHEVHTAVAVMKARNHRSAGLLQHLGFVPGQPLDAGLDPVDADEISMQLLLCEGSGSAALEPAC